MAVSVLYHLADVDQTNDNPIFSLPSCATRMRINPACVAMPDHAGARDAKRRHRLHEQPPRSLEFKRRRRDFTRGRGGFKHRRRGEESAESKRRRGDVPRPVPTDMTRKTKMESVDHEWRGPSSCSRSSIGITRPVTGCEVYAVRREDARRTGKIQEREREQDTTWRSRFGSAMSEPRARPDPCAAQAQQQLPGAAIARARAVSLDVRPPQECTESFEEFELRRRETQRKREEARQEMDKVVQTVFFNDPFISPLDCFKR